MMSEAGGHFGISRSTLNCNTLTITPKTKSPHFLATLKVPRPPTWTVLSECDYVRVLCVACQTVVVRGQLIH